MAYFTIPNSSILRDEETILHERNYKLWLFGKHKLSSPCYNFLRAYGNWVLPVCQRFIDSIILHCPKSYRPIPHSNFLWSYFSYISSSDRCDKKVWLDVKLLTIIKNWSRCMQTTKSLPGSSKFAVVSYLMYPVG